MKKLLVAAYAALGCVAFGDGVDVLDTDYLSFSTGEAEGCERPWEIVEGAGFSGGPAVRGPFGICEDDGEDYDEDEEENYDSGNSSGKSSCAPAVRPVYGNLHAEDNGGAGTLSFYWKKYGNNSNPSCSIYIDGVYVSIPMYGSKATSGQWNKMEIPLYTDDSRSIQWSSQGYSAALMLSDIVFTPAPETLSVTFDANGGTVSEKEREYAPGDYYEKLPVPTRKNFTFLGWHRDSLDGAKEDASYRVPLKETTVLVAKWGSAVSAFNTKQLTAFKASGADKWYAVQNGSLKTAEVEPKGVMKKVASACSDEGNYRLVDSSSILQTTTVAAGYLKFSYSLATFSNPESGVSTSPWISLKVLLDGEEIEYAEVTGADGDSGEKTAYVYVPSGKHSLKFAVEGNPGWFHQDADGYWEDIYDPETGDWIDEEWVETPEINETGPLPRARVWGLDFEPAGPQPDLKAWMGKVKQFKSWRTGDLAKFAAAYKTRMIADSSDYEARILYAATRLGALAENKLFTDTAKTFGMTIDWATLSVKPPKPKFDKKSTPLNTLADKTISLAVPVIKDVQKALQGIPDDWDGSVSFDASEWPIDETVAFDVADVKFALAGLEASLAGLYYLGGYDLTANWPKMQSTLDFESKIPSVKSIPATGDAAAWEKAARCFRTSVETYASDARTAGTGAFAVNGDHLLLRLAYDFEDGFLNETNQIQNFDFYVKSGDRRLNIWGDIYGENGRPQKIGSCFVDDETGEVYCEAPEPNTVPRTYFSQTNVYCKVWDSKTDEDWIASAKIELVDGAFRLNVDLSKINLGTKKKPVKFSSKTWTVSNGEVGIVTWRKSDYENFEEYPDSYYEGWEDDDGNWLYSSWNEETRQWENLAPWEDPADYQPYYEYYSEWTGSIDWSRQSDSERKFYKHLTEQTAMFSKVRDASRLSAAKRHFESALRTALAADEKAQARPSDGPMHFFEYDPADEAKIVFARNNTERALAALGNGVEIDWAKVAEEFDAAKFKRSGKPCLSEFDYTLLPDEGMTRLFLGALFEGKIDRSMLPPMRANAYGDIVPDFEGMKDPTIGGLFPDMTADAIAKLSGRFASERELDRGEHVDPAALDALPKPGEKISLSFESYKGWTASGLPKGWKWDKAKGVLTGTASATTTVKFTKGKNTAAETIEVGAKPSALLFSDNEDAVAVTGTGLYNVGATVKAVAAVKAGYVFAGWYAANGSLASSGASYSFKMPREGVVLTARTLPLSGEYGDRLVVDKNSGEEFLYPGEDADLSVFNNIESGTPFSVAVAGLPAGLSIMNSAVRDAESGFWYGTTDVVGKPAKAGVYYATFSVKNNGGFKWKHVVKFTVGDATEKVQNAANIDFSSLDGERPEAGVPFYAALPYGPKAVKNGFVAVKKIAVSGLPAGLKMRYTSDTIEIAGYPGAAGKYTPTFTVTYADKKTAKSVKTIIVDEYGSAYVQAGVIDNDPDGAVRGTATPSGVRQYGESVKFTATSKNAKKWFFAGWYLDPDAKNPADKALSALGSDWAEYEYKSVDFRANPLSAQIGDMWSPGDGMYAKFVTKEEDYASIAFPDADDPEGPVWRVEYDAEEGSWSEYQVDIASETKATLSASGLPAGTKVSGTKLVVSKAASLVPGWYDVALTAKTASGVKTTEKIRVYVANLTAAVDKEIVSGLDTGDGGYFKNPENGYPFMSGVKVSFTLEQLGVSVAKGWTLAVSNLPKGWTYNAKTGVVSGYAAKAGIYNPVFTVSKKSGGKTVSYKASATFEIAELARECVGTFIGLSSNVKTAGDGEESPVQGEYGLATVSVSASGAITASCVINGKKYSFSGKGYDVVDFELFATLTGKYGKNTVKLLFEPNFRRYMKTDETSGEPEEPYKPVEGSEYGVARLTGSLPAGKRFVSELEQNVWKVDSLAEYLPAIADGTETSFSAPDGEMSLRFGKNGYVECAYSTANGVNTASSIVSGICHDGDEAFWRASVDMAMPPKTVSVKSGRTTVKKTLPGCYGKIEFKLSQSGDSGELDTVGDLDFAGAFDAIKNIAEGD